MTSQLQHINDLTFTTYYWEVEQPKALVHIVHGMSEHALRYEHVAAAFNSVGFSVVASDLRGHGATAGDLNNIGFFADINGWELATNDVIQLSEAAARLQPSIPLVLFGHSMGSFLVRSAMIRQPQLAAGVILSGTAGHPGLKGSVGKVLARINAGLWGKRRRSTLLMKLSFAAFNRGIKPRNYSHDWLSRDPEKVKEYVEDPRCMQGFSAQFFVDLATGVLEVNNEQNMRTMDAEIPVLLLSGEKDPVGQYGKGSKQVHERMSRAGVQSVQSVLFEGARHELVNETNRDEVIQTAIDWVTLEMNLTR